MKKLLGLLLFFPVLLMAQSSFDQAEKLFRQGNYSQSKPLLETLLKQNPGHLKTIEYLGDIAGHHQSWDTALDYYQKLRKLKPSEANYQYKYGGALGMKAKESNKFKALGMIGEVRSSFEKAIQLEPKHIDARWALIELYLQLPVIVGGSEKKALQYAEELATISSVDGYLAQGRIAEYFERYVVAEQHYRKAVAIGGSQIASQKLADLYKNKMNSPEKAKQTLDLYAQKKK